MITIKKIFQSIEHYISIGKKRFIIYPYGKGGKLVEHLIKKIIRILNIFSLIII